MRHHDPSAGVRRTTRRCRALRLLLVAMLLPWAMLTLAGCASSGGPNEITVWHYFSEPKQVQVMTDYQTMFERSHPGARVKNVFVPYNQLNSKLIAAAGAKAGPDVVVFNGADTGTLALAGALAPLDQRWAGFADRQQFPDQVVHRINGTIYSVQGYVNLLGLWYNADLLGQLGVKPPTTLTELEAAMRAAKDAGHMGITLCGSPQSQGEWQAFPWLTASGFDYGHPDEAAMARALAMARGWVEQGYLSQEAVTWDQTVPFQQFATGNVAFAENGNWQLGTGAPDAAFHYGVVPLPLGDSGKVYLGGEGEAVGAFSKNPDLAWQYLRATYFDRDGQLLTVRDVGSIPSRRDAAQDPAVVGNAQLKPFVETITKYGTEYPPSVIPPEAIDDVELAVGQAWSAALGGQRSPNDAAAVAVRTLRSSIK